jgi:hypothetical protein
MGIGGDAVMCCPLYLWEQRIALTIRAFIQLFKNAWNAKNALMQGSARWGDEL